MTQESEALLIDMEDMEDNNILMILITTLMILRLHNYAESSFIKVGNYYYSSINTAVSVYPYIFI